MSVMVTVEFKIKPEKVDEASSTFSGLILNSTVTITDIISSLNAYFLAAENNLPPRFSI